MIEIATAELKKFFAYATPIKDTKLMNIYGYIKIICDGDSITLYKSNGHSFCIYHTTGTFSENTSLLLEVKAMTAAIEFTTSKIIRIRDDGKKIVIDNGVRLNNFQKIQDDYSAMHEIDSSSSITLSSDFISSLYIASQHAMPVSANEKGVRPWMTYIHSLKIPSKEGKDKSYIVASCGGISYFKHFKENFPTVCLDADTIDVIKKFDEVKYSRANNYDYFDNGIVSYGFIKSEGYPPAFEQLVNSFKTDKYFIVNRQRLLEFCQSAVQANTSAVPAEITLTANGKKGIKLEFLGLVDDESQEEEIECDKKNFDPPEFIFLAHHMITVIKNLGCEKIQLSHIPYHFLITTTEDKNYIGAIMQLAKTAAPVIQQ